MSGSTYIFLDKNFLLFFVSIILCFINLFSLCSVVALGDFSSFLFFFQAEDGIRDVERSRGLGDVYKRQSDNLEAKD